MVGYLVIALSEMYC